MLENAILSIPPEHRGKLNLSISFNQWMRGYKTFMEGEHYLNVTIPTLSKYRPVRILATDSLFDSETWKSLSAELLRKGAAAAEVNIAMPLGRGNKVTAALHYLETKKLAFSGNKPQHENDLSGRGQNRNCDLVLRHTAVDPEGNARPCALFPANGHTAVLFGNVLEEGKGLSEKASVIRYYYMPAPSNETCGGCRLEAYCDGCIFHGWESKERCKYKQEIGTQYEFIKNS